MLQGVVLWFVFSVLLGGRMLLASARRGEMAAGTAAASGDPDGCGCGCGTCSGADEATTGGER